MAFRKNTKLKLIGFSPDEWAVVCRKSVQAKLRTGTFIRRMAVQGEVKMYDVRELQHLVRAFRSIGTNLNQIAAVANSTNSVTVKDIEDLQEQFQYFDRVMKNYLRELKPTTLV